MYCSCLSCISFDSYIKPQRHIVVLHPCSVVYLLTPTSNHNSLSAICLHLLLYIFWLLHQTTTSLWFPRNHQCCISFNSYIKPQLTINGIRIDNVVYLLTPTSNHNFLDWVHVVAWLYIFWLLHQTTTCATFQRERTELYIFWLLHQTTTFVVFSLSNVGCISFDSYIKPQPSAIAIGICSVVYLLTPTSNHNLACSNLDLLQLYIFWLLHQTTTNSSYTNSGKRCISFDSYIKPQPLKLSTERVPRCISFDSYIKPQLMLLYCWLT